MSESSTVSLHTIDNGQMTPTLKIRRHAVTARYGALRRDARSTVLTG